jgi:cytochrome P450
MERSQARHRFAYFPFSVGRHPCLGQPLAMTEAQLILAVVSQRYRIRPVPGHSGEHLSGVNLRLRHGLSATIEARGSRALL